MLFPKEATPGLGLDGLVMVDLLSAFVTFSLIEMLGMHIAANAS